MRLLFAISVASFCTVLWLALSLARRIRRERLLGQRPAARLATTEFFEAGEFRTPRSLRLNQEVSQPGARRSIDVPAAVQSQPQALVFRPAPARDRNPAPQPADANGLQEAVIIDSVLHFIMPPPTQTAATLPHRTPPLEFSGERKSPQSARSGSFRRVDLSHYNKDLGDLTDPYTHSPRGPGVRPSVAKNA